MKRILIVAVAIAATAGMQSTADAVLVKVLIDDFDVPPAATQASTPGGTTVGPPLGPGGIATSRTLTGRAPGTDGVFDPGALVAGAGELAIALGPGETALMELAIDPSGAAFEFLNPHIIFTALTASAFVSPTANLRITILDDVDIMMATVYDSKIFVASSGPRDVGFLNPIPNLTSKLYVVFEGDPNMTGEVFRGTTASLVANPEPATMALIGLGVLGGALGYRRRRKDDEVIPASAA